MQFAWKPPMRAAEGHGRGTNSKAVASLWEILFQLASCAVLFLFSSVLVRCVKMKEKAMPNINIGDGFISSEGGSERGWGGPVRERPVGRESDLAGRCGAPPHHLPPQIQTSPKGQRVSVFFFLSEQKCARVFALFIISRSTFLLKMPCSSSTVLAFFHSS